MKQKHWDYALGVIVGVLLLSVTTLVIMVAFDELKTRPKPKLPEALVRINLPNGHAAAAHLGDGVFLTAAHVTRNVTDGATISVAPDIKFPVKVLWENAKLDVALVKAELGTTQPLIHKYSIDCSKLIPGEPVMALGFPLSMGRTEVRGHVGGSTKAFGLWESVNVIIAPVAGGMSGGPVESTKTGKLRGITVGGWGDVSPYLVAVPTSTICTLLATGGAA